MPSPIIQDNYQVPGSDAEFSQLVKASRFIGTCGYAANGEDALDWIANIRSRYPNATHHAWAYKVDSLAGTTSSSDDGEPGGTAGRPMLAVLEGSGLVNTVIVVTRYYGGIKLGPGGLVRAYSDTARQALARVQRIQYKLYDLVELSLGYPLYSKITHLINRHGCRILASNFGADVVLMVAIPHRSLEPIGDAFAEISGGRLDLTGSRVGEQFLVDN